MAGLYKPSFKDKRTGKKKRTSKWYAWYRTPDGRKLRVALCRDRSVAQTMLGDLIRRAERNENGLADPYAEHRKRRLADHLQDWLNSLLTKATNPRAIRTARQTYGRAQRVFAACGFQSIQDISASRVQEYIAGLRADAPPCGGRKRAYSCSLQTMSYYLRSCKQFCRWLVKDRRHNDNPLVHLQGWNARLDRRHDRRALDREEITWLLETTRDSTWVYRGLTGLDRFMLYAVALNSGLRASELASLTPGNFRLAENPSVIHLFAAYTKNQKEVDQPISADLTPVLRDYLAGKPADQAVWPGTWARSGGGAAAVAGRGQD